MRLDLHNHTFPEDARYGKETPGRNFRDICPKLLRQHHLDGIAITNFQSIEVALRLAQEYPQHIIVGAEYQVLAGEGTTVQIVVLRLDAPMHEMLMAARLRGLKYFTDQLKQYRLPYFMAHVGWGIPAEHPHALELLESSLAYVDAIEVVNVHDSIESKFSTSLATYYRLATVGGSEQLISPSGRRGYTEAPEATNIQEFMAALQAKQVRTGLTHCSEKIRENEFSVWRYGKNLYLKELEKLWHSRLGWNQELMKGLSDTLLLPLLEWLPYGYYLKQRQAYEKKITDLRQKFIAYLKLKETTAVFSCELPMAEKKLLWGNTMAKIYQCFES